ncbi:sensor histidine kinase [Allorhizocola rhizosphaerae]|uniref:sensor histidine kinase n=1 Tax=Allorhizocola rhizosphaerae TaxID=1872709 RepID=UPI000E3C943D|nr:sensor histidine kinase [Allorhizocola rhizosphaerae]
MQRKLKHIGLFYADPDDLLHRSRQFIREGQQRNEPVLVAQPPAQLHRLAQSLGDAGDGVALVDMSVAGRNPGRILPWVLHDFVMRHPGRSVRVIGEPVWPGRSSTAYPACVQYEALVNVVLGNLDLTVLCPYDASRLPPETLDDASRTHPLIAYGTGPIEPSGEFNHARLARLLNQPLERAPADAFKQVFGWTDLSWLRQIVTAEARRAGLTAAQVAGLQLAVTEAATNAVRHGGGAGTLRMWHDGGHLVLDVNSPKAFPDLSAGRLRPAPDAPSGRGLALINHVCDLVRWSYQPGQGTSVRMWMRSS